jgi:FkbM family methyltransferase
MMRRWLWRDAEAQPPALTPASRFYAYLGPHMALTQLCDGHYIYVDPKDDGLSAHLIARGYWEQWIERVVRQLVRPGDRVVEVGANLGYYTLLMAAQVGDEGRIHAFEANPGVAARLAKSVAFNGYAARVTVSAEAAGDRPGTVPFFVFKNDSGGGHLHHAGDPMDRGSVVDAQMRTLDGACGEAPIDLLRMDAEGSELLILAGARRLLARSPALRICMEWDLVQLAARSDVAAGVGSLIELGFRFWKIEYDGALSEIPAGKLLNLPAGDIVACRMHPFRGM